MTNRRVFCFISVAGMILVVVGLLKLTTVPVAGQAAQPSSAALKTAWGDPDLQGIWSESRYFVATSAPRPGRKRTSPARTIRCSPRQGMRAGVRR